MFELTILRQDLLAPLLIVAGAIGKKQSNPLLSHILLTITHNQLLLTATDLEIEITARIPCVTNQSQDAIDAITVPAKKMVDIIRSLEDNANPCLKLDESTLSIREGRSLFKLATLPADNYPQTQEEASNIELTLSTQDFTRLLQSTHFALSQQDVRVFLNCLLLEVTSTGLIAVGTDGHRMAIARLPMDLPQQEQRLLIPRRGIQELLRLIAPLTEETVTLSAGKNYIKLVTNHYTFISRLIESRFPIYTKAIPQKQDKHIDIDREMLKRALSRIVILAHEKSRAIMLHIQQGLITLVANNQEKEEAIESLEAQTIGDELKIGINATYLLDVLSFFNEATIRLSFSNTDSSVMVTSLKDNHYQYIIMPMKL
jgi:DNA polymerase-3 subunit beta